MDFEGEYTIRTASNQQTYEPNTVYPDAVLNIARESASVFQLKRKWEKTPPMLNLTRKKSLPRHEPASHHLRKI